MFDLGCYLMVVLDDFCFDLVANCGFDCCGCLFCVVFPVDFSVYLFVVCCLVICCVSVFGFVYCGVMILWFGCLCDCLFDWWVVCCLICLCLLLVGWGVCAVVLAWVV